MKDGQEDGNSLGCSEGGWSEYFQNFPLQTVRKWQIIFFCPENGDSRPMSLGISDLQSKWGHIGESWGFHRVRNGQRFVES